MQITTPLVSLLLLALTFTHPSSASPSHPGKPRDKFVKRTHHAPHHGGGGIFGSSGGSMLKTVAGGTALAAGAGFAGTAGGMAAHHLFEGHHDGSSRDKDGDNQEKEEKLQVPARQPSMDADRAAGGYPAIRNAPRGGAGVYPVAMLMSDGSYRAIPGDAGPPMVQPPLHASGPVGTGQGQAQTGAGGGAVGGGPFVFPRDN